MAWLADSNRIIFSANEPGHGSRFFIQDATGGAIHPITPEGFDAKFILAVSLDGKQFAARDQQAKKLNVCQVEDGKCAPVNGSEEDDYPLQWSADGKYIYVGTQQYPDPDLWRIELTTGHRQLWKRIVPTDPVGAYTIFPTTMTPDGKSFASTYVRSLDQLYVVEGVK